jgi:hypothetical protein
MPAKHAAGSVPRLMGVLAAGTVPLCYLVLVFSQLYVISEPASEA